MKYLITGLITCILMCIHESASAQRVTVSTNALDYLNLGALNVEAGVATGRHFSITAGAVYNPWRWGNADSGYLQNKQRTFSAGIRWWPWNVWSGWWLALKGQVREYSSNLFSADNLTEEGDAFGASLSLGYSLMISRHLNIDFGAGAWAGSTKYTVYSCPTCGRIQESGRKGFVRPNDIHASIAYVF